MLAWIAYRLAALGAAPDLVLFVSMAALAAVADVRSAEVWVTAAVAVVVFGALAVWCFKAARLNGGTR